jgi:hypothetical protein
MVFDVKMINAVFYVSVGQIIFSEHLSFWMRLSQKSKTPFKSQILLNVIICNIHMYGYTKFVNVPENGLLRQPFN